MNDTFAERYGWSDRSAGTNDTFSERYGWSDGSVGRNVTFSERYGSSDESVEDDSDSGASDSSIR